MFGHSVLCLVLCFALAVEMNHCVCVYAVVFEFRFAVLCVLLFTVSCLCFLLALPVFIVRVLADWLRFRLRALVHQR